MYSAYASVEVLKENQSKLYQVFRKEIGDTGIEASGIYLYRIVSEAGVVSGKFMLRGR